MLASTFEFPAKRIVGTPLRFGNRIKREHDDICQLQMTGRAGGDASLIYRAWEARLSPTMRQSHVAGERMFVDYAGTTLEVIDASTGELRPAQLFVAALGSAS